jgi:hypothetical protein
LEAKWNAKTIVISTTGDEPWPKNTMKRDAERKLVSFSVEYGGIYVQQSVEPFVQVLRSRNPYQSALVEDRIIDSLRGALAPKMSQQEFVRFLSAQVRIYYDVDQWLEDAARFDLSIGLRLHGNMVAFQSGCPAVWIHHDARTQELAETMALPSMDLKEFNSAPDLQAVKNRVNFDMNHYAQTRITLLARYIEILEVNNIQSCLIKAS